MSTITPLTITLPTPTISATLKNGELLLNKDIHTWITSKNYTSADVAVLLSTGDTSSMKIRFYTDDTGKTTFSAKNSSTIRFSLRSKGSLMSTDQLVEFTYSTRGDYLTLTPVKPTK